MVGVVLDAEPKKEGGWPKVPVDTVGAADDDGWPKVPVEATGMDGFPKLPKLGDVIVVEAPGNGEGWPKPPVDGDVVVAFGPEGVVGVADAPKGFATCMAPFAEDPNGAEGDALLCVVI